MTKQLCDLKKTLKTDLELYVQLVSEPTHICQKCGRAANDKQMLCKPVKICKPIKIRKPK